MKPEAIDHCDPARGGCIGGDMKSEYVWAWFARLFICLLIVAGGWFIGYFLWRVSAVNDMRYSPMSNDEIISEVKKCNDANLVGQVIFDKQKRYVIGVQCITKIKEAIEQPTAGWEA